MAKADFGPFNYVRDWHGVFEEKSGWWHSFELPDGRIIDGVNTLAGLKGRLAQFPIPQDLTGKRVLDIGAWDGWFSFEIERRGAQVVELAPYVWDRPVDPAPILALLDALDEGRVHALLITSQAQVGNLFDVARDYGRTPRLAEVAIGAQGPVAESALARHGLQSAFRPAHGHMGALVLAAAEFLSHVPEGVLN